MRQLIRQPIIFIYETALSIVGERNHYNCRRGGVPDFFFLEQSDSSNGPWEWKIFLRLMMPRDSL